MKRSPLIIAFLLLLPMTLADGKIRVLFTGQGGRHVETWLQSEPLIDYIWVPSRDFGLGLKTMTKMIRLYFPRTYEDLRLYDYLLLNSPEVYFFANHQIEWMYDAIQDGAGGMNTASVMSQIAQLHNAWANSILSDAFPNDAQAVVEKGSGGRSAVDAFWVVLNKDFPDPVLDPFIPYGVENIVAADSRIVILREGSQAIAYQVGNFPGHTNVPFIAVWDYGKGRTMTTGDVMGASSFFSYPTWIGMNEYIPDMFMNLVFYSTRRKLIEDVQIYHNLRDAFLQLRTRMAVLTSLMDFVDRFGARSEAIQEMVFELEDKSDRARDLYLDQEFVACQEALYVAFEAFTKAEIRAMKLKDEALLWVYVVEWLATNATIMISGYVLWSLMVRRRLYRAVQATRLAREVEDQR